MESVHGVDVSWMSKHSSSGATSKDSNIRAHVTRKNSSPPANTAQNSHTDGTHEPSTPKPIPEKRPNYGRSASTERIVTINGSLKSGTPSPSSSRRNSWLSSISSKFSSSPGAHNAHLQQVPSPPPSAAPSPDQDPPVPQGPRNPKNAILEHAQKVSGDVPYTPAPPKSMQPSFLQSALRRLSSSGGQNLSSNPRGPQHGLCERKVLNVDRNRERCAITELDQSKLRRVAFCVDVEIASGPRYLDEDSPDEKKEPKKIMEKGEDAALKQQIPDPLKDEEEGAGKTVADVGASETNAVVETATEVKDDPANADKDNKKKEKKKRSEEERKARKEKKRKTAEANGTVPVEVVKNASDTSLPASPGTPRTQVSPTTDPVRIYRRCCQLRETPILKRITEQLGAVSNQGAVPGVVVKLDLTGYWLQLPDLITLSDYLAVVPVKELIMESCGLTDEGVRVILAGLLAAKCPHWERKRCKKSKHGEVPQGGFVERVVFKDNSRIGREGWRYIATFIAMCRSLKSLDLSKIRFPQPVATPLAQSNPLPRTTTGSSTASAETACVLGKAIGGRLAGKEFELLNMAETGLTTDQLGHLVDSVIKSGLRRLGLAGNSITAEGMQHVARYIREGKCEGLDLGGNDLKDQLGVIAEALTEDNALYALSLADCNLTPDSLWALFPALAMLSNFRFIDLSQNHGLFDSEPSALSLLRRILPKMPSLKRIHLTDVSMTPEQAIALAEILPESPNLAHVNIMENPLLAALASAKDEANQEEACALYASLMAAVRVSKTIICVDIEVPSPDSSEVVKALAKQVVAYCLWNMERGPVAEISEAAAAITEAHGGEKEVAVPDVLLHLVGHIEGFQEGHDDDEPAPDDDYVIGGTGVVKALGICLRNRGNDSRRPSADVMYSDGGRSGSATPSRGGPVRGGKAKDMSKNLLGSARKIRARLQPALVKESRGSDRTNYQRLLFLDQTLEGMIKRFEDEFPETRLRSPSPSASNLTNEVGEPSSPPLPGLTTRIRDLAASQSSDVDHSQIEAPVSDDEEGSRVRPMLSRHNSDVSLASRALSQEEGRMHRMGQQFRREILNPSLDLTSSHQDPASPFSSSPPSSSSAPTIVNEPRHLQLLRAMVEGLGGDELKAKFEREGSEKVMQELNDEASALREQLKAQDPEGWEKFAESQEKAMRNMMRDGRVAGRERVVSAIE